MILEKLHNSYFGPYKQIYIDTASALTEANNNVRVLEALLPLIESFSLD
jgi:hypothetical protein